MLAPVRVIAAPEPPEVTFTLPAGLGGATIDWTLAEETGGVHEGRLTPDELPEVAAAEVDGTAYRRWRMALPSACRTAITACPWRCAAMRTYAARCS